MKSVIAGTLLMVVISVLAAIALDFGASSSSTANTSTNGSVRLDKE